MRIRMNDGQHGGKQKEVNGWMDKARRCMREAVCVMSTWYLKRGRRELDGKREKQEASIVQEEHDPNSLIGLV